MRSKILFSVYLSLIIILTATAQRALADGAITNGATHTGVIEVGGLDTWTITAAFNDSISASIGEVVGSDPSLSFSPWIRLRGPNGDSLAEDHGDGSVAQVAIRAPQSGTYTILVAGYTGPGYPFQQAPGSYILTVAKTPGPYAITPGDEGGPIQNAVTRTGAIPVGDLDPWTFTAAINDNITVSIGEVAGSDPSFSFSPWIRLLGPDGASLAEDRGDGNSAQFSVRANVTGTYTLLVAGYSGPGYPIQQASGNYILTVSGLSPIGYSLAGVLAVVGSLQGSGAFFRTRLQMYNPGNSPISGKLVFHTQAKSGGASDPSLIYSINAKQTIDYPDILPSMGVSGGLGSLDIMTTGDSLPITSARIFSDAGPNGTAGFFLDPVTPQAALQVGESAVIISPPDPVQARLNLGIRSLAAGASFQITVRTKNGVVRGTRTKTYQPHYFEQVNANSYVGLTLEGSDTITFTMISGQAIIYGAQTDNKTQDPSVQYARPAV